MTNLEYGPCIKQDSIVISSDFNNCTTVKQDRFLLIKTLKYLEIKEHDAYNLLSDATLIQNKKNICVHLYITYTQIQTHMDRKR